MITSQISYISIKEKNKNKKTNLILPKTPIIKRSKHFSINITPRELNFENYED